MAEQAHGIVFQQLPGLPFFNLATKESVLKKATFLHLKTTGHCGGKKAYLNVFGFSVCPLQSWPHSELSVTLLLCFPAVPTIACLSLTHSRALHIQTPAEPKHTSVGGELHAMSGLRAFEYC